LVFVTAQSGVRILLVLPDRPTSKASFGLPIGQIPGFKAGFAYMDRYLPRSGSFFGNRNAGNTRFRLRSNRFIPAYAG